MDVALDEGDTILWLECACPAIDQDVADGFSRLGGKSCAYYKSLVLRAMGGKEFKKDDYAKLKSISQHERSVCSTEQGNHSEHRGEQAPYVEPVRDLMLEKANVLARSITKVPVWIVRPDAEGNVVQPKLQEWEDRGKLTPARPEAAGPFDYALCFEPDGRGSYCIAAVRLLDGAWQIFYEVLRHVARGSYAFVSDRFNQAGSFTVEPARGRTRRTGRHRADCILCGITPKMPLHSHTQTEAHVAQFILVVETITGRLSAPKKGQTHERTKKNQEQPRAETHIRKDRFIPVVAEPATPAKRRRGRIRFDLVGSQLVPIR